MKKLLATVILGLFLLSGCAPDKSEPFVTVDINGNVHAISGFGEIEDSLLSLLDAAGAENIVLYDCSELSAEILENRQGTTVVERCVGLVTDADAGDGKILNTTGGYYISYRGVYHPKTEGTLILSYMVYGSDNNYIDDIVERYDFVLSREWED